MAFNPFPPRQPVASARLPLTLISLDDWALATLVGADAEKYLQGQVTADVSQMTEHQHLLAAHCDPKGKMWSNLRLFRRQDGFALIERRSLRDAQLTELKKYAVFSKVTIAADDEHVLLGVAGFQARAALKNLFSELPDAEKQLVSEGATSILWFEQPAERFLLVTDVATAERVTEALRGEAQLNNSQQWLALNIEAGLAVIDAANSAQFIPQATNLQALGGISFKKGCYTGQEMVARAKFRGANKRALWYLAGHASRVPEAGEDLELKMGDNWRRTGTILAAVQLDDGRLLVQVVMNNDMEPDSVFRVRDDAGTLSIEPLPYSLEE
ncbi:MULTISPECIES: tRNA-modifying protein YgfZ [Lelliottia]|jgi:folate-binding protein YgfZ|uniref:tRNA-modifying protein YgfZ n=1 Tax=Lelliottia aquatilis TaxID=2080838 RepID=A0ABX5A113_9ENTR|nr:MULTISPECIES: tRNA-modifying protein YgfZ [Lelliottia]ASV56755.1 Folate-dependent protein for Fe-S cluster synthesis,repair in oxidative stress [Lelliottia jeotgali]MBL5885139.1 tRNA-modifying protein YgfZ [Lelliottia aquatilis]NTZ46049.1 tRNA-modifying protein YgfZ [Lelliottia aquatilis]POZ22436.1 tRNA-modifying protein YgfZ [Lelliottia aquatilis]POZ26477.1 tRNA-modifying protein YgfZ [Lelliottia sp. 7254-16]